jgi:Cd2+/Zn2+-exporting ATPase
MGAAGSDVAINSATVVLMNNELNRLPLLIRLSRRTIRVVHQNMLFGVGMIVVLLILAGLGILKPELGAVLHTIAAVFVIFNSARLVRFGEELHHDEGEHARDIRQRVEKVAPAKA